MKLSCRITAAILIFCGTVSLVTSCSSDDETIYVPDPTDAPSTKPIVTVVYSPDALGDRSYNDLIYSGVENISIQKELRTLHLSPATRGGPGLSGGHLPADGSAG